MMHSNSDFTDPTGQLFNVGQHATQAWVESLHFSQKAWNAMSVQIIKVILVVEKFAMIT